MTWGGGCGQEWLEACWTGTQAPALPAGTVHGQLASSAWLRHHSPAMRLELGITTYLFFQTAPQLQPLLHHEPISVSLVHPKF